MKKRVRVPMFEMVESGKWFDVEWKNTMIACCDCGLSHVLDFRVKKKTLQMRAERMNQTTRVLRRRRNAAAKRVR